MDLGDAEKNIDECHTVHDIARQNTSDSGVPMIMMPRRMWDLWSNRVVPICMVFTNPTSAQYESSVQGVLAPHALSFFAVSHPWLDADKRRFVETPINSYEWPVPLPAKATLERMLHLTSEKIQLAWLDVLCLRQRDARKECSLRKEEAQPERLREEEWRTDIPTIGGIYANAYSIVYYYSGLGLPFEIGDLDCKRHWLNRAWTLQETKEDSGYNADIPASCPPNCSRGLAHWQNVKDLSVRRRMNSFRPIWGSRFILGHCCHAPSVCRIPSSTRSGN